MKKKKLTKLQKEYKKERKRVQSLLRSYEKKGYVPKREAITLPQIPKKITKKSIEELKEITPYRIRSRYVYLEKDTGEIKTYSERSKELREEKKKKIEKKKTKKEGAFYPTFDIIDLIREKLVNTLSSKPDFIDIYSAYGKRTYMHIDLSTMKNKIISAYDDYVTDQEDLSSYRLYLEESFESIQFAFDTVYGASSLADLFNRIAVFLAVLFHGSIPPEANRSMSDWLDL